MINILTYSEPTFYLANILEAHKNNYIINILPENKKRKIKPENILLDLGDNINLNDFYNNVSNLSTQIDVTLLTELLELNTPYDYIELAKLYFNENASYTEQIAMLFCLQSETLKFIYVNNNQFRLTTKLEAEEQKALLEQKHLEQQEFERYYQAFIGLSDISTLDITTPYKLLHKTDKQSIISRALYKASAELKTKPLDLCRSIGFIKHIDAYFEECFTREYFPKSMPDINIDMNELIKDVEMGDNLNVFSIDDSFTTEIDDAFSIQYMNDHYIIGIHISAPAVSNELDEIVAQNISTVYSPKLKITMLPENIIEAFSLNKGQTLPVISIYFKVDLAFEVLEYSLKLENLKISENLRIEQLEQYFNEENLNTTHNYPYEKELKTLYSFANVLEEKRGKLTVNTFNIDYTFFFDNDTISLKPRFRGNPIDKLVSELMILANGSYGRLLTNAFIPAIYRVKQPSYPVKMTLQAKSHAGLNIDYYTWATSPLRRSADFINQKQLIHLIKNKKSYYSNTHPVLLEVVDNFDIKYNKYLEFQAKMERYWSLCYLIQENTTLIEATFIYKALVQLTGLPLTIDLINITQPRSKGDKVKLLLSNIDLLHLTFDVKIIENSI